jgi:hypothetical protein
MASGDIGCAKAPYRHLRLGVKQLEIENTIADN